MATPLVIMAIRVQLFRQNNAEKLVVVLGMGLMRLSYQHIFLQENQIIRGGSRIELLTTISGVDFDSCYQNELLM